MVNQSLCKIYKREKDAVRAERMEAKAPRILAEEALLVNGLIGELVGVPDDRVPVTLAEG